MLFTVCGTLEHQGVHGKEKMWGIVGTKYTENCHKYRFIFTLKEEDEVKKGLTEEEGG